MSGKSDVIDAEHAARQVLASIDMPVPKSADGHVEAIRLIKIARDSAVKARSTTMITLKATLVTADVELRAETEVHRSRVSRGEVCSAVRKDQSCRGHIRPSSAAANALFEYLEISGTISWSRSGAISVSFIWMKTPEISALSLTWA